MTGVRQGLSTVLLYVCAGFDALPRWDTTERRWHLHGQWGCSPLHISGLALTIAGKAK